MKLNPDGDIYLFSGRRTEVKQAYTPSLNQGENTSIVFDGAAKGMVSRVYYYNYALSYSEIQTLMNMGPSPKIVGANSAVMTTYLADTWWTNNVYTT